MSELEPKGVCFFAYNNEQIDYVKIAVLAAKYVKKFLDVPVCIITDAGGMSWIKESQADIYKDVFDYIVITDDYMKKNILINSQL